jgi:hypothetical protein
MFKAIKVTLIGGVPSGLPLGNQQRAILGALNSAKPNTPYARLDSR